MPNIQMKLFIIFSNMYVIHFIVDYTGSSEDGKFWRTRGT